MVLQPQLTEGQSSTNISNVFTHLPTPVLSMFFSFHFSVPLFLSSADFQCFILSTSVLSLTTLPSPFLWGNACLLLSQKTIFIQQFAVTC